MLKWGNDVSHVTPPSWVEAVSRPRAPPFDHRSCCQTAMTLFGSAGLTSTQGSSSALRKFVPGPIPEISQPAKGLGTDTCCNRLRVNGPAVDGAAVTSVNAPAMASSRITVRERIRASSLSVRSRPPSAGAHASPSQTLSAACSRANHYAVLTTTLYLPLPIRQPGNRAGCSNIGGSLRGTGSYWGNPKTRTFAELLIDCEEEPDASRRAGRNFAAGDGR